MAGEAQGGGQQAANGGGQAAAETVSKADFEAKVQEVEKLSKDLEDMRLEVFSPTYMEFLDNKDKGGKPPVEKAKEELPEDLEKLSKKELLELATKKAEERLQIKIDEARTSAVDTVGKEQRQREVAAFSRTHEDFETYRPIMYGLSLEPKNKDLTLQELYDKSKDHVARIHTAPSEAEKARQAKLASEKPGGDSQSFEKYQKMPADQVAKESLEEVKAKLGPIPSA